MSTYALKLSNGAVLRLKETIGKKGQKYLCVRDDKDAYVSHYGVNVNIAAVGGNLATSAQLLENDKVVGEVTFDKGVTTTGNPKVSGTISTFQFEGETHSLSCRMSQPKATTANVLIRSSRPNGTTKDIS